MSIERAVRAGGLMSVAIVCGALLAAGVRPLQAQETQPATPRETQRVQPEQPAEATVPNQPAVPPPAARPQEPAAQAPPAPAGSAAETRPRVGERSDAVLRTAMAEASEFWPAFRGYRLKITDTLIVAAMALLLVAMLLLWRATRKLVRGAELAAERQLRAYLAVAPKGFGGFRPNTLGRIDLVIKNLGQTPAQKIRHRFEWAVLPNPLPARHAFARPSREAATASALLPRDETASHVNAHEPFTAQQIEAISRNEARVHCWGYTEYEDVFRGRWRSRLAVSVGGEAFARAMTLPADHPSAPQWDWEYGSGHNEIEWG